MAGFLPPHPLLWRSHLFFFLPWQSIADSYSTSLFPLSFFPLPSVSSSDEPPTTETRPRVYSEPPLIHFEPPRIDSGPLLVEAPIHFQRFWLATPGPSQRPVNVWCCGARNLLLWGGEGGRQREPGCTPNLPKFVCANVCSEDEEKRKPGCTPKL